MQTHNRIPLLVSAAVLMLLASLFNIAPTWGSWSFYFTGLSIVAPLLGAFLYMHEIMALVFGVAMLRWLGFGSDMPMLMLTFGLPTLVSSLVFRISPFGVSAEHDAMDELHTSRRSRNVTDRMLTGYADVCLRVLLPLLCMLLFVMHPVGGQAFTYSLYWLVPVALCALFTLQPSLKARRSFSLMATGLSATFISHAVGSVMWLYSLQLSAQYWLGLVPVVPIERMLLAGGIALGYTLGHRVYTLVKARSTKTLATA